MKSFIEVTSDEELVEALNNSQRQAKKRTMKRIKSRVLRGRKKAERRTANQKTIEKRSRKRAIGSVKKSLSNGKNTKDMSYAARQSVERRMKSRKGIVDRLAKRWIPKTRKDDRKR